MHARNCSERLYNVFVIFFALLVVGSCISRVSATIQQVIKLNSEVSDRKRTVGMYLKINKLLGLYHLFINNFWQKLLAERRAC